MSTESAGYFAVARGVFDHILFKEKRPLTRLEAWLLMISRAAWKPIGIRRRYVVVHIERGQLAASIRDLARLWRWPKSNVERFLHELDREELIRLGEVVGTHSPTHAGAPLRNPITCITICNYDKYQRKTPSVRRHSARDLGLSAGQGEPDLLRAVADSLPQPTNHKNHESRGSSEGQRGKPRHGATGRGMIWLDYGTQDWQIHADDYRNVRGAEKLPETRIGGRGNWFRILGEATKERRA